MQNPQARPQVINLARIDLMIVWHRQGPVKVHSDLNTVEIIHRLRFLLEQLDDMIMAPNPRSNPSQPYFPPRTLLEPGELNE